MQAQTKPKTFELRRKELIFLPGADTPRVTALLVLKPFGARWQYKWVAAWGEGLPPQWRNQFWQSLQEGAEKQGQECDPLTNLLANQPRDLTGRVFV